MKKSFIFLLILSLLCCCGCTPGEPASSVETTAPSVSANPLTALDDYLPQEPDETVYQLQLTPEQAANFDSASLYIFYNKETIGHLPVYKSDSTVLEGDMLTSGFNGKLLYARDDYFISCLIPTTTELETKDSKTLFRVAIRLGKHIPLEDGSDDTVMDLQQYWAYMVCDRTTGQIEKCTVLPDGEELQGDPFRDEWPEADLSEFSIYAFPTYGYLTPTKDEAGNLLPVDQWEDTGSSAGMHWSSSVGLKFLYGRLSTICYPGFASTPLCYLFEVHNKDGSSFCTEPQPLEVLEVEPPETKPREITVQWSTGNRVLIFEENGLQVYLRKAPISEWGSFGTLSGWDNIGYALEMYNSNDVFSSVYVDHILYNDTFLTEAASASSLFADSKQWSVSRELPTPLEAVYGELEEISSLSFTLSTTAWDDVYILPTTVKVELSGYASVRPVPASTGYTPITVPCLDALAQEQVLWEEDGIQLKLVGQGMNADEDGLITVLRLENQSDEAVTVSLHGQSVNGYYFSGPGNTCTLPPHTVQYADHTVSMKDLGALGITSIGQTAIHVQLPDPESTDNITALPVSLAQAGSSTSPRPKGKLLLEEQGLRVVLLSAQENYGSTVWTVAIENSTDQMLYLDLLDKVVADINGAPMESGSLYFFSHYVAANSTYLVEIDSSTGVASASFRLGAFSAATGDPLFETTQTVQLPSPE